MILDLWSFIKGGENYIEFQGSINYEGFNLNGREIEILEPINYKGEAFKAGVDRLININIDYIYKEKCHRCLTPTFKKINTILSGKLMEGKEEFESLGKVENEDNSNKDDSYENFLYYENNNLNLEKYIIEQVILSIPMKTICKENCKGLCPKCGTNLNDSQCDCVHEDIDPRLEKLKDFFPKK